MAAVVSALALVVSVGASISIQLSGDTKAPTSCASCVQADMVWCYHDDVCYPHGSSTDRQPFACPGTTRCAANDCNCKSCDDQACWSKIPNAQTCHGWTCNMTNQYCPPNRPGSSGNGYCCVDNKWVAGTCNENPIAAVEQVHVALGADNTSVNVGWASDSGNSVTVLYAPVGQGTWAKATSNSRPLKIAGSRYTHVATLTGLSAGLTYSYSIVGRNFTFTHRRPLDPTRPQRHIIFGDLGASHGFSLCDQCTAGSIVCDATTCSKANKSAGLIAEVDSADMMLHVGDFAYNFDTDGGTYGDQFMRNIEQVAAYAPYMVSHGNHEDTGSNLAHYVERFRNMPSNAEPSEFHTLAGSTTNSLYYSWDAGLVHYIALSTELWFGVESLLPTVNKKTMLAWLEKDLIAANKNRANVPWIVAHGHRDIYCSTSDDSDCNAPGQAGTVRSDLEPLFFKYGLDFWINGHEHSYERTYPLYQGKSEKCPGDCNQGKPGAQDPAQHCFETCTNPNATIYIVTGAAGSPEMHEGFDNQQPSWSAFRSNTFGYSRLLVHNATHVRWQQVQTDPTLFPDSDYGRVIDDVWIVQEEHGPFDALLAPKGTAWPVGDETPSRTQDHWAPLLNLDDGSGRATSVLIREFKKKYGEVAWAQKEDSLLRYVNSQLNATASIWEDVREDGASSGAWFRWKEQSLRDVEQIMRRRN